MLFELDADQARKLDTFMDYHEKSCRYYDDGTKVCSPAGAIGGVLTFSFTPTSLGTVSKVLCACGESVDLTDYDSW